MDNAEPITITEPELTTPPKTCPRCDADLRITGSVYKSERSDNPDEPDKVYLIQKLQCMNPACGNSETYEKRHLLN